MTRTLTISLVFLLAAFLGMSSCNRSAAFPESARETILESAWDVYTGPQLVDVGFEPISEIKISRAWRAKILPKEIAGEGGDAQVWCVELSIVGIREGDEVSAAPVWLAIQADIGAQWSVQPLVLFSAIWPYTSCGKTPWYDS